jgi:glycosyltransferase involved in cell wall biosynthesis
LFADKLFAKRKFQKKALKNAIAHVDNIPDVLMTQILLPKGWQFELLKKKFNIPWIHLEQGSYFRQTERKKWNFVQRMIIKKCKGSIDRLLASSAFVRKDMKEVFPERKIDLIPNHVDTNLFCPDDNKTKETTQFLHISTLDPKTKNPIGIIDACKLTKDRTQEAFKLCIVSDGETKELKNYIDRHGLQEIIEVTGSKQWEELPEFYQQSDAFVLNSIYETFSIVLAEAWACGIPTITTPVGIGYDIPKNLGYNTRINDPESLSDAMINFMQEKQNFDSNDIRTTGLKYSAENVLKELNNIIVDVCK